MECVSGGGGLGAGGGMALGAVGGLGAGMLLAEGMDGGESFFYIDLESEG